MNDTRPLRHAIVIYRGRGEKVALALPVIVLDGDGWALRVCVVARIVGDLHFHLYDFEAED